MELFEHLPQHLKSRFKQDITPAVRQRLEYLWRAAHSVQSVNLSHILTKQFVDLGNEYGLDFPNEVQSKTCQWCSSLLLPSVTSRTKVKKIKRNARAQKKRLSMLDVASDGSHPPKLKNIVVGMTQLVCLLLTILFLFTISFAALI
jgi:RNase P subunit RPR2